MIRIERGFMTDMTAEILYRDTFGMKIIGTLAIYFQLRFLASFNRAYLTERRELDYGFNFGMKASLFGGNLPVDSHLP